MSQPVLYGPITSQDSFSFSCFINATESNPDQRFEVKWDFNGKEFPGVPRQNVSDPVRLVPLDGKLLQGHLNKYITCNVRSFYVGRESSKSIFQKSVNKYFAGWQVTPEQLDISEGDPIKKLDVWSTLPIVCGANRTDCCLQLKMGI
ncbi:hypothetical protein EGW08_009219, partial [Elysia chlorotica]